MPACPSINQRIKAVKVFESATTDVVGEKAPTLWLEYARFCRERGKFANAQKVYLRAVEVLEPAQVSEAWRGRT